MEKECLTCKRNFKISPSEFELRKYCSRKCFARRIEKICGHCKKVYSVKQSKVNSKFKYCSMECQNKAKLFKKCPVCGIKFNVIPSRFEEAKYCSKTCQNIAQTGHFKDITGQKFNNLTAIKRIGVNKNSASIWLWACDCGNQKEIPLGSVITGNNKGCGCLHSGELVNKGKDISGMRFGHLVAIKPLYRQYNGRQKRWIWECLCDCGKKTAQSSGSLSAGHVKTCGCRMHVKGENAYNWSGGRKLDSSGYVCLHAPEHPAVQHKENNKRYVAEHRLVMEKLLGRFLLPSEEVHHLNAIKDDNRPENLEIWARYKQPRGARASDLVAFAREILAQYGNLFPEK